MSINDTPLEMFSIVNTVASVGNTITFVGIRH